MIALAGSFRLPLEKLGEARPLMAAIIAASNAEAGCRGYSYAEDVSEAGLFRVFELWDTDAALKAHFDSAHMKNWVAERAKLGFYDRVITRYEIAGSEVI